MGGLPLEYWWFVVIGTALIVGFLFAFVGSLVMSNRALKEEKDFTLSILETTSSLILVVDQDGVVKRLNRALQIVSGFSSDDIVNKHIRDLPIFRDSSTVAKLSSDEFVEGRIETELITVEGTECIISWNHNIFRGITDNKLWSIWTGSDITQLKETQKALEEINLNLEKKVEKRTEELRSLIEQSPFGVLVFNPSGRLVQINDVFLNMLKSTEAAESILGDYDYLSSPFFNEKIVLDYSLSLFSRGGNYVSEPLLVSEAVNSIDFNPAIEWIVARMYSVQDSQGEPIRVAFFLEDITEQKKTEEIFNKYKEQQIRSAAIVKTIEQERKRISQDLHDSVQQLITGAKLKLETFEYITNTENKLLSESQDILMKASGEIRNVINDLHPQDLDKFGLLSSIETLLSRILRVKEIKLDFTNEFDGNIPESVKLPIYRILQEGVNNIIKHSQCKNCEMKIYENKGNLEIILKDDGVGFEMNEDKKTCTGRLGHGLLNMAQRAEFLGGAFHIDSAPGSGTTIFINIPLGQNEQVENTNSGRSLNSKRQSEISTGI